MRKDVVREGSVLSNHFVHGSYALVRSGSSASNLRELVHKNHARSTERCYLCNDVVLEGSMSLNHSKLVHKNHAHLASPVKM